MGLQTRSPAPAIGPPTAYGGKDSRFSDPHPCGPKRTTAFIDSTGLGYCMSADLENACVVGLGVVGIPVAAMLAKSGIRTVGLDVDEKRVAAIAAGRYPMDSEEPGMDDLLEGLHESGMLTATTEAGEAVSDADAVIVVVQTPVESDGRPRYGALKAALTSVGQNLKSGALVVVESTIAPGTMGGIVRPILEETSGMTAGKDFLLGHCPERVMPGKLLRNIIHYDRVLGGFDDASRNRMRDLYSLYVEGDLMDADMTTAEVVKTTENAYRDVEIAFANEVALICQELGVDVWRVRELVNRVEGRNMHLPGVGVGGHCIPKDGLLLASAARDVEPRMLRTARDVNEAMPQATAHLTAATLIEAGLVDGLSGAVVAVLGASYLPQSDDTRHTPSEALADSLAASGAEVRLVDPFVEGPLGDHPVSHDVLDALDGADVVVLATAHNDYLRPNWSAWLERMRTPVVIDGRGVYDPAAVRAAGFRYRGIGR